MTAEFLCGEKLSSGKNRWVANPPYLCYFGTIQSPIYPELGISRKDFAMDGRCITFRHLSRSIMPVSATWCIILALVACRFATADAGE